MKKGFTVIEIVIAVGLLGILMSIVIISINPAQQFARANNATVKSDMSALMAALVQCYTENHSKWQGLCSAVASAPLNSASDAPIGRGSAGQVDLCGLVQGNYIQQLPVNPIVVTSALDTTYTGLCSVGNTTAYSIGYSINKKTSSIEIHATADTKDPNAAKLTPANTIILKRSITN